MRRCVIVGGAKIENAAFVKRYLREDDFYIFCDCGLAHREVLGVAPDLIVGDFDSHEDPHLMVETIVLPTVKDDTDTVFAVKEALRRGFSEFLLLGAAGQRLDHTLGNVAILLMLRERGKHGILVDDYSEMEIADEKTRYIDGSFRYFSLLALSGTAENVTVDNARYPLKNAAITCEYPLGVSNEPLPGKTAAVTVGKGTLLLVRVV